MRLITNTAIAASLLALGACSSETEPPPEPEPTASETGVSAYVRSLVGTYRIVGIDGRSPELAHGEGASVTISPERIHYQSQCIYGDWTYAVERGVIYTERYHEPGSAMCARGFEADEELIERVLDAVTGWRRLPDGTLEIQGPAETLELRLVAADGDEDFVTMDDLAGEYRVAGIDNAPLDGARGIALSITEDMVSFEPRCLGSVWRAEMPSAGVIRLARDPDYGPVVNADGEMTSCLPTVGPEFGELSSALDRVNRVQRTEANGILLSGGGRSVTLFSQ